MYEQYYAAIQPTRPNQLDKYRILLDHMMSLLCAYRTKMAAMGIGLDEDMTASANRISYKSPRSKMAAEFEAVMITNTYREDYITYVELFLVNSDIF